MKRETLKFVSLKIKPPSRSTDDKGFSVLIISKLVEGNYPNYRQVIPSEVKERIALPREELLAARAGRKS